MARPTTKTALINASETQYATLLTLIQAMPATKQAAEFTFIVPNDTAAHWQRDRNVRDVISHLYEWHRLLLNWIQANQKGQITPFLPAGYNWRTYGGLNQVFWERHQTTSLTTALAKLATSHAAVMAVLASFTDEQLFSKGVFEWTGTTTLGSYFISATSSHYMWALKKLKRHAKTN